MRWPSGRRWAVAEPFRDLAFSRDEALRHLPYALRGFDLAGGGTWPVTASRADGGRIVIDAAALPPRRLSALICLPRCRVSFAFSGLSQADQELFLANFDRAFQRGGG